MDFAPIANVPMQALPTYHRDFDRSAIIARIVTNGLALCIGLSSLIFQTQTPPRKRPNIKGTNAHEPVDSHSWLGPGPGPDGLGRDRGFGLAACPHRPWRDRPQHPQRFWAAGDDL